MRSLRDEYQGRVHYVSYLAKSRQSLLGMQSRIHGMLQTLNRSEYLTQHLNILGIDSFVLI